MLASHGKVYDSIPGEGCSANPSPAVYSFVLGSPSDQYQPLFLPGNYVNFRFGWWMDSVWVNGVPYGSTSLGGLHEATKIDEDDVILRMSLGILTRPEAYGGGYGRVPVLKDLEVGVPGSTQSPKTVDLRCSYPIAPSYLYDREKLGLALNWLGFYFNGTLVTGCVFSLSAIPDTSPNTTELEVFWKWYQGLHIVTDEGGARFSESSNIPLYLPYVPAFEEKPSLANSEEEIEVIKSQLQSEKESVFDLFTTKVSGAKRVICPRFINHVIRCNHQGCSNCHPYCSPIAFGGVECKLFSYEGFAVMLSTSKINCVFQGGCYIDPSNNFADSGFPEFPGDSVAIDALSCALTDDALVQQFTNIYLGLEQKYVAEYKIMSGFKATFDDNLAKGVLSFFMDYGLSSIIERSKDEIGDAWDVYKVAAINPTVTQKLTAILCAIVQITGPIILIINADQDQDLQFFGGNFTVLCMKALLVGYLAMIQHNNVVDTSKTDLKLGFYLLVQPDCKSEWIYLGVLANMSANLFLIVATIFILMVSSAASDVVLNALALIFLKDIDNDLVTDATFGPILGFLRHRKVTLKSKNINYINDGGKIAQDVSVLDNYMKHRNNMNRIASVSHGVSTAGKWLALAGSLVLLLYGATSD